MFAKISWFKEKNRAGYNLQEINSHIATLLERKVNYNSVNKHTSQ
jgi:hypothetical protein